MQKTKKNSRRPSAKPEPGLPIMFDLPLVWWMLCTDPLFKALGVVFSYSLLSFE